MKIKVLFGFQMMILGYLLGLVLGEMVTNLLIIPGDCCIGGVRHILSSFSVVGVISSPTRILSKLPSSTPFPNHRPQGNLQDKFLSFCSRTTCSTKTMLLVPITPKTYALVSVPRDLVADHNALHQPLCVKSWVIVPHLHRGQLSKILALIQRFI